jgi:Domain of unknown function (DUF5753)
MAPAGDTDGKLDARLNFRLTLGAVLTRPQEPLRLWVVVAEAALHKNVGGREIMSIQLRHVADLCRRLPNITVQVLPRGTREHYLLGATVTMYKFKQDIPELASVDTTIGEQFFERDSSVAEAIRKFEDVKRKALDPRTSADLIEEVSKRSANRVI